MRNSMFGTHRIKLFRKKNQWKKADWYFCWSEFVNIWRNWWISKCLYVPLKRQCIKLIGYDLFIRTNANNYAINSQIKFLRSEMYLPVTMFYKLCSKLIENNVSVHFNSIIFFWFFNFPFWFWIFTETFFFSQHQEHCILFVTSCEGMWIAIFWKAHMICLIYYCIGLDTKTMIFHIFSCFQPLRMTSTLYEIIGGGFGAGWVIIFILWRVWWSCCSSHTTDARQILYENLGNEFHAWLKTCISAECESLRGKFVLSDRRTVAMQVENRSYKWKSIASFSYKSITVSNKVSDY